jgi:DNA-binding transcriptional LysR family regulator
MLELRHLRHLVVLARTLNYVRAAEELCITQPTLSRSIQTLERHLGLRLFDRDRGGVALTPQGRAIANRAAFLLTDAEDLERQSKLSAGAAAGHIRFGMVPMPAHALLQPVLSDRLNQAPGVTHEVVVRDVEALSAMLIAGDIEFFVSHRPPQDLSLADVEQLATFPHSLVVRAGHPLLRGASEEMRFPLLRSSWTGIPVPQEVRDRVLGAPNVIEDFNALRGITLGTDAMWITSAYAIHEQLANGSLVELLRAPEKIDIVLYTLKRRTRSPLAQATIESFQYRIALLLDDTLGSFRRLRSEDLDK